MTVTKVGLCRSISCSHRTYEVSYSQSTDALGHRFDTVKTRLQCSPPGTYRGAIDCLVKIVKNEARYGDFFVVDILTRL